MGFLNNMLQAQTIEAIYETANKENNTLQRLHKEGILLKPYNWNSPEFQVAMKETVTDFFNRHPEVIRGSGQFAEMFPNVIEAVRVLDKMGEKQRITPEEYLAIHKALHDF